MNFQKIQKMSEVLKIWDFLTLFFKSQKVSALHESTNMVFFDANILMWFYIVNLLKLNYVL